MKRNAIPAAMAIPNQRRSFADVSVGCEITVGIAGLSVGVVECTSILMPITKRLPSKATRCLRPSFTGSSLPGGDRAFVKVNGGAAADYTEFQKFGGDTGDRSPMRVVVQKAFDFAQHAALVPLFTAFGSAL